MNDVVEKKLKALDEFVARLLASLARDDIAKIILHGSVAEGTARPDSDVDVLVFQTGSPEIVEEACVDASLETIMSMEESVEPLVYPISDYWHPQSYFVYCATRYGKEVYSMSEEELKQEEIEALHELAIEYLEGAQENLANQRYRIATDVAYNAAELAVKGLLLLELDRLPTTHAGVVNRFGELYIKSGRLPKEFSKRLRQGLRYRNLARYDRRAEIGADKANEVIKLAEELVAALDREKQARGSQCENSSST